MANTKNVLMKETYIVTSGPLRGRNLFFNEVYPLDEETRKEVKDAGVGSDTQRQVSALGFEDIPVVTGAPTSAPANADEDNK